MDRPLWLTVGIFVATASFAADVVVQRWGKGGHVQRPRTLKYVEAGQAGKVMRFDLSSLPARGQIYRARLLMARAGGHGPSFDVFEAKETRVGKMRFAEQALQPVRPYCRWFDVTASVRTWAAVTGKAAAFLVRGVGYDPAATALEISYEGKLKSPPKQVSEVEALYRSGQVFITFREIEDLCEGRANYTWGELTEKIHGFTADGLVPRDGKRELRYRVYRHEEPITSESIGRAELLAELAPGSGVNTRIVRMLWQGENRPRKLDEKSVVVRLGVRPGVPLAPGVGVHVHTVRRPGKVWYAVVTSVNGVENTVDLTKAVAGPITQKLAHAEPVLQAEQVRQIGHGEKNRAVERRYVYWSAPPEAPRPLQYGLIVQYYPKRLASPAPLEFSHGQAYFTGPTLTRRQRKDSILLAVSADPGNAFRMGVNNCLGTLKSFRQGTWAPWPWRRYARLIAWARKAYDIDDQQIYCYGSHWGMWELRHPEIFSLFIGWGSAELTKGFQDWDRLPGLWGPPSAYAGRPDMQNPYRACNFTDYVEADPARRMPFQILVPHTGSHTSEMSYPSLPRYKRALMDARQPFAASVGKQSWGWASPVILREFKAGRFDLLRDQAKPAFGNCTLDDNPGNGDTRNGDPMGMLNGYLLWDAETIVDEPGRWEMAVYLHESAPLASCKVDLTPRHCQRFKPQAGQRFNWTNVDTATARQVESGTAVADKHGLVTLRQIRISKGRHRILIRRAR